MSGHQFYKDTFSNYIQRRSFLLRLGLLTSGIFLNGCYKKVKPKKYEITGQLNGQNAKAGHVLRDKIQIPIASNTKKVKTLIVGAGITGLSAARWLKQNGEIDFEILELENHPGGNSHFSSNNVSSYPLGAHYITIANNEDLLLQAFLQEIGVITHYENNIPSYNEYYLTFDPEERLLINGEWQEGLIPDFGVPEIDKKQIKAFLKEAEHFKMTKGNDGKFIFNIPISASSNDETYTKLEQITFKQYLQNKGYTSKYLLWYLNYACKDDFGQELEKVSAWAGLHYFSSRRGKAANAEDNAILTWPQGNGWLMEQMSIQLNDHLIKSSICYELKDGKNGCVEALVFNHQTNKTTKIEASKVILCTPQFINKRILQHFNRPSVSYQNFSYSPWLIANITLNELPNSKGMELCWDNVAFGTPSVGYVNASQQKLEQGSSKKVLTYYLPLCKFEPTISRLAAYTRTYDQWLDIVMPELTFIHPGIEQSIEAIDFWIWGHGMIAPTPNLIFGQNIKEARKPIQDKIFFAHSDLSGISIFEEAFHQGIRAAKEVLNG
ncbi:NAD(P)-binding protein [Pedobacter frigiditerrae]|uniref:NAD(P)-binding protein n=1 Tax=Pedobacter frigiditerrae TaxID=2530452 RepID=UPI00292F83FC|nr:NAD(P)-binding protein [Pedobacter frigiditerrae]